MKKEKIQETNIRIVYEEFINWYFKESDAHWILKDIKFYLLNKTEFKLNGFELFNEVGYIPAHLRADYDYKKHLGQEYEPSQCTLI